MKLGCETTLQCDTYFQCSQPPAPPATRVHLVITLQIRGGMQDETQKIVSAMMTMNVLMHLHMGHPLLVLVAAQSYEGFREPYLICSVTTPGHVTAFGDSFVFPCGPVPRCAHCCSLSA